MISETSVERLWQRRGNDLPSPSCLIKIIKHRENCENAHSHASINTLELSCEWDIKDDAKDAHLHTHTSALHDTHLPFNKPFLSINYRETGCDESHPLQRNQQKLETRGRVPSAFTSAPGGFKTSRPSLEASSWVWGLLEAHGPPAPHRYVSPSLSDTTT